GRRKRTDRLHVVDGLMIALLNIDEVIQVIRGSDNAAAAKERLMSVFDLSEIQAAYILDTPLRRLTRYDRLELEREAETLRAEIEELTAILESESRLREVVSGELASGAERVADPRPTVLLEGTGAPRTAAVPLEVADDPCQVLLSSSGLIARTPVDLAERDMPADPPPAAGPSGRGGPAAGPRAAHDVVVSSVRPTARGARCGGRSRGRLIRITPLASPSLPPHATSSSPAARAPAPP